MWKNEICSSLLGDKMFIPSFVNIDNSINFHVEDMVALRAKFASMVGKLKLDFTIYKPPFDNLLVTYRAYDLKGAAYLIKKDNSYHIFDLVNLPTSKEWRLITGYASFHFDSKEFSYNCKDNRVLQYLEHAVQRVHAVCLLLACKNVIAEEVVNGSPSINKKRIRKGKKPLYNYKVLKVRLFTKVKKGTLALSMEHNRLHLCRGHFKLYTEDRPLLGKHIGVYWWQPHLRGQNKDGFVDKDYEVIF